MATIEQRPNGTWRTKIRKKGYPALSASLDTKAEAQRWASEIEGDMSRKRFVDTREAEATTVAKAFDRYAREVSALKKGARQELTRIKTWSDGKYGSKSLAELRSSDLAEYRDAQPGCRIINQHHKAIARTDQPSVHGGYQGLGD